MNAPKSKATVAIGMSGGVDSAVTAHLLLKDGYNVVGITMQTWDGSVAVTSTERSGCYGPGEAHDIESARKHAERLGIKHFVIPMLDEFRAEVLDQFRSEYMAGRTPNPCVRCNRTMKFGTLLHKAVEAGINFDYFATGHYARISFNKKTGRHLLLKGVDARKDQSYFLSQLRQDQLAKCMFPLGTLTKTEVKALAREMKWLDLVEKKESQDFVDGGDHSPLFGPCGAKPGQIVDIKGNVLGKHRGIVHYTIGQRKGLGLGGTVEPLYVVKINEASNTVVVGPQEQLLSTAFLVKDLNWIAIPTAPAAELKIKARIRQQHKEAPATVLPPAPKDAPIVKVVFDEPQLAITPGQTAVFYDGDVVVGAGTIAESNAP